VGAFLLTSDTIRGSTICTATLVCSTAALTAAHCFDREIPNRRMWFTTATDVSDARAEMAETIGAGSAFCDLVDEPCVEVTDSFRQALYTVNPTRARARWDLAMVKLAQPFLLPQYPKIARAKPLACQELMAVGYGNTEGLDSDLHGGVQNKGLLRFSSVPNGALWGSWGPHGSLEFKPPPGTSSQLTHGDSGGPVLDVHAYEAVDGLAIGYDATLHGVASGSATYGNQSHHAPTHTEINRGNILRWMTRFCAEGVSF